VARVVLIADDAEVEQILARALKNAGHRVDSSRPGDAAFALARTRKPHVIVLDAGARGAPASAIAAAMKADAATRDAQLVVAAQSADDDAGPADAVLVKPFSVRELCKRVEQLLRKSTPPPDPTAPIAFGVLRVDRLARRAQVGDVEIDLTALEFKLLVTLCDRRGKVQTRDVLLGDVWNVRADIATRTVDTHVKRLREKLGEAGEYIETVRGSGYRFLKTPLDAEPK
jgi:two-component system phosphate regulon response regulator PhoB